MFLNWLICFFEQKGFFIERGLKDQHQEIIFSYFRLLILYLHLSHLTSPLCAQVVPNTVSIAREDACEARVITEASSHTK